jgi:hypothetical protein
MAFDTRRGVCVVAGGVDSGGASLTDTWEWDGADWALVPMATAPALQFPTIVYDEVRGVVVMVGEQNTMAGLALVTASFDGISWSIQSPATSPPPRMLPIVARDTWRDSIVLTGGIIIAGSTPMFFTDTWEYR